MFVEVNFFRKAQSNAQPKKDDLSLKKVSNDLFAGFSDSSEESVEEAPQVDSRRNFSRLAYEEKNSPEFVTRREPSPRPKKVDSHRHSLFDDEEVPKRTSSFDREDRYFICFFLSIGTRTILAHMTEQNTDLDTMIMMMIGMEEEEVLEHRDIHHQPESNYYCLI